MNPIKFLNEVKIELQKVVWPTAQDTIKYTVIVILFSLAVAMILGAADFGLLKIFEKIVSK